MFVVCGPEEHIHTLHQSHSVLKKKTNLPIYIVTDHSRNEIPIKLPNTIHVETPISLNHHQASIYLKTSLHKLLPTGCIYVYLDTDILAYGNSINEIFNQYKTPIIFAPDHCKMDQFSPYAVECNCLNTFERNRQLVYEILDKNDPLKHDESNQIEVLLVQRQKLESIFLKMHHHTFLKKFFRLLVFLISYPRYKLNSEFYYNRKKHLWYNNKNIPIKHHISNRRLAKLTGLKWKLFGNKLALPDGRYLWKNSCHHLQEYIQQTFNIHLSKPDWQHWNGGVFIFSDESKEFMDTWHDFTMKIFEDPAWKTRDQGTLIATVWKFGLQNHPTLDNKWNMILDYHNPNIKINENDSITLDGKSYIQPEFVHIYHHWGDKKWDVWNKVMQKTGIHE